MIDITKPIKKVMYNGTAIPLVGEDKYSVVYKNIDGSVLKEEKVSSGGVSTPPANPTFDSEYLEFDYWAVSGGDSLNNITRDTIVMPQYKTKLDTVLNQRPTYLICYFSGSDLSPTFYFASRTNTYIDFGDGSSAVQVTSSSISHTYQQEGLYVVTVYGDSYKLGGHSSYGLFTTSYYSRSLLKAYLGENAQLPGSAFQQSYDLKYAVLPSNLTSLGISYSFSSCKLLANIVIPNGVSSITTDCFSGCTSLTNIIIPSSVTTLSGSAFAYCTNLTDFISNYTNTGLQLSAVFRNCSNLNKINIPDGVTSLANESFYQCYGLSSIDIPSTVTTIGDRCFYQCNKLKNVTISNNVTSIGSNCFYQCYNLNEVTIPSSVTTLSNEAFNSCYGIHTINLYEDFDLNLKLTYLFALTDNCLIDIANKLKDNTQESTAKSLTFTSNIHKNILNSIFVNTSGEQVSPGTAGAVSLLEFITNKNWTVSFTA